MPASLRFVTVLLGLGVVGALASALVQYRQFQSEAKLSAEVMSGGSVAAGKEAIDRFACGSCHVIPGIADATGEAGPALRGVARRAIIAGKLPNDPQNMATWVRTPQHVSHGTAMPQQPMDERDAKDITAYLMTLNY